MPRRYSSPVYVLDVPWQLFDLAIVAALLCFVSGFLYGRAAGGLFGALTMLASAIGFALIAYGSFIEPRRLKIHRYAVGTGTRALKIAFISDVHVGPYKGARWVRRLTKRANALGADVILLGGDFLYKDPKSLPDLEPFKGLQAPLGVYAILGNHDEWKARKESLVWFEASGIPLLHNRAVRVEKDGATIAIAGADDDWYGETDLSAMAQGIGAADLALVMLHNPDLAPPAAQLLQCRAGTAVFLSGHTHAGQIRLPFLGPVMRLPHHLPRRYDRGLFSFDGIPLVLGAGTGESGPRARLFCPPEIVLVEVKY